MSTSASQPKDARMAWHENPLNAELMERMQRAFNQDRRLFLFLGAGLSFGAARMGGRSAFDSEYWGPANKDHDNSGPRTHDIAYDDDGLPLPSWPWLVSRMRQRLVARFPESEYGSLCKFFRDEGPLDSAELFRRTVGDQNYREFLQEQFDVRRHPFIKPTPSHEALIALDPPLIFTTNFDELIEDAYLGAGLRVDVSAEEAEFISNRSTKPDRHLVKLHGTIGRLGSIVLTRTDYAASRRSRREMFAMLRGELAQASFLFVGFSLSDPNFNILLDDVRDALRGDAPVSYCVQGRKDTVKERYLEALGVNTVWLDGWNCLPDLLRRLATA